MWLLTPEPSTSPRGRQSQRPSLRQRLMPNTFTLDTEVDTEGTVAMATEVDMEVDMGVDMDEAMALDTEATALDTAPDTALDTEATVATVEFTMDEFKQLKHPIYFHKAM